MRYLKLEWPAVILASLLFGYSVLGQTFCLCVGSAYCWLPVILWLAHRLLDGPGLGACLALTALLALCFLAGFVQHFYYICIILFVYLCVMLLLSWSRYELRGVSLRFGLCGLALLFTAGLVAVQFLPTLELSLHSVRSVTKQMEPGKVLLLGRFSVLGMLWSTLTTWTPHSFTPYFGSSLLLIPFALWSKRHRQVVIALSAALGYALLFVLSKHRPELAVFGRVPLADSFRWHERFVALTHFMIVALAGIGLSVLLNREFLKLRNPRTRSLDWFSVLAVLYLLFLSYPACVTIVRLLFRSSSYMVILLPLILIGFIFLVIASRYPPRVKGFLAAAVLLAGLLSVVSFKDTMYMAIDLIGISLCIPLIIVVVLYASDGSRRMKRFAAGMAAGLVAVSIVFRSQFEPTGYFTVIMTAVLAFFLYAPELPPWTRRASMWAVLLLILLDVVPRRQALAPVPATTTVASANFYFDQRVKWTKAHAGYDRVLISPSDSLLNSNIGSMFQFFSIDSYDSLTLARWKNYVRCIAGSEKFDEITRAGPFYGILVGPLTKLFLEQPQMVGLTSLRYFLAYEGFDEDKIGEGNRNGWKLTHEGIDKNSKFYVRENTFALPRTYLVNSYAITRNEQESLQAIRDNVSSLSHSVILENGEPSFPSAAVPANPGRARIGRYGINEVELQVEAGEPSLVILTDSYYPGWNAFVDGERKPVWRANSLFRAVETPAGNHTVLFRYQPASLRRGAAISLGTLTVILCALLLDVSRRRRKR